MQFDKKEYQRKFNEYIKDDRIVKSSQTYKIKLFLDKAENSLAIAEYHKNIKPNKDLPPKIHWNYWAITISYYSMLYSAKAAILSKGYEVKDHFAAQIALGHLFVPDEIEKEDLELLNQAHKIFEDEYIKYFEDARIESHAARYSAIKTYTEARVAEIFKNAREFILKIMKIL
ncbi:HEPN domain-containing protein [Candidatus Woesearchaeota archaeon]|nr:HEPN domain-containing protein [Candidatus Woesearchaeota archaeon]